METNINMENEKRELMFGFKNLPDNTTLYFYDSAKDHCPKIENKRVLVQDAVLLLLFAQSEYPINGRISLMKQVFLLTHEVLKDEKVQDGKFVKHNYGYYSFQVTNDIKNLEFLGLISRKGKTNTKCEQFQITEKGILRIKRLFESLSSNLQDTIRDKRKTWDQWGTDGILRYMYSAYPDSIEKSLLKEKYKPIKWGKAKG